MLITSSYPLVSVCIPAYNRPRGLARTLELIRSQGYRHLEIIISDDCSDNKEVRAVAETARSHDERISYYRQDQNLGIIENHSFLLQRTHGKYVMWACDDDWWHPRFIEDCVRVLESDPSVVLCMTNSTMVLNDRFYPLHEKIDTHGIPSPQRRMLKVLENILWSNHAFYGVMRARNVKKIAFQKCLAFDVAFVCQLSLVGYFIQLPNYYFRKSLGGSGARLQSNLVAIKVEGAAPKLFPGLTFGYNLAKACTESSDLSLAEKWQLIPRILLLAWKKDPFPFEKKNLINQLLDVPRDISNWLNYKSSLAKTGSHDVTMKLFELQISPEEVRYCPSSNTLELTLLKISLKLPEQLDLLAGYRELIGLMYQHDIRIFQIGDGRVIISLDGTSIFYTASNMLHVFREVFIKKCYHVDITCPTVVFDLGMNVGLTSLYFSRMKNVDKVFAFELFPDTVQLAEQNFALNRYSEKIEVHDVGLLDRAETRKMKYSKAYNSMNGLNGVNQGFFGIVDEQLEAVEVSFRAAKDALGPLVQNYPDHRKVLKIDVEGSEYRILESLEDGELLGCFDTVMVEWHDRGPEVLEERLRSHGFKLISTENSFEFTSFDTGMIYAIR